MKRYKVLAAYEVELESTIEANSLEDAWEIALELDGSEFVEVFNDGWRVYEVYEEDQDETTSK